MGTLTYTVPVAGTDLNSLADPEIATALSTILTWANGNLDAVNLSALLAQSAGVNQSGQTTKSAVSNAGAGTRTNTAYGALGDAADQVTGIVLPTNGLLRILYQATWKESVTNAAAAAIFIGSNQLQVAGTSAPFAQNAAIGGTAGNFIPLASNALGLWSTGAGTGYSGDATTGQAVFGATGSNGSICYVFAAAGTYTVSVQFKASSGTVTAQGRKLWVEAVSFV